MSCLLLLTSKSDGKRATCVPRGASSLTGGGLEDPYAPQQQVQKPRRQRNNDECRPERTMVGAAIPCCRGEGFGAGPPGASRCRRDRSQQRFVGCPEPVLGRRI